MELQNRDYSECGTGCRCQMAGRLLFGFPADALNRIPEMDSFPVAGIVRACLFTWNARRPTKEDAFGHGHRE
jgi:hypothetical protein